MSRMAAVAVLLVAASLEAGGDAVIRTGLYAHTGWARVLLFALGAAVLFGYGWTVNAPAWDFGRLLGLYVVFFFVIAQVVSWGVFRQPPTGMVWMGGALIVAGGVVIALAR